MAKIEIGKPVGFLTPLVDLGRDRKSHKLWLFRCICGTTKTLREEHVSTGNTLSCGCHRQAPRIRPYEYLFNRLKATGHSVELTYEEFLEFTKETTCHYCGSEVHFSITLRRGGRERTNLDRKDSTLGYSKSNCVVCCKRCNIAKNNHFTYEEWVQIGKLIRSWR